MVKAGRYSFPASARIRTKSEFDHVRAGGKRVQARHFLLLVARGATAESRLGVIITTKIEKRAVRRNKLRRRLRELFRKNRHRLTRLSDLLIIARRGSVQCTCPALENELLGALERQGLLKQGTP